ncbi:MAG: hypothetical protein B5M56_01440 [Desulfococcus sp. 4484_241]|nr:MAG: hypothetical protein B5M56_01440 [Desulfococcus sp. 4484_241]
MISRIGRAVGYSALITLIYAVAANLCYYYFKGEWMFENWHYYSWVEYLYAAIIIFVAVSVVEFARTTMRERRAGR